MQHRVDTVHLTVRSPTGHEGQAARLAERFTRDVLERFSQIVEAASPGRVVLIHRLAARWSLTEAEMADPANAASCAAGLADSVAAGGAGSSRMTDTIVTFDDEAGWLAAYLRARAADAAGAWFHAAWREAERQDGESPLRQETVLAALSRLQATGELAVVLAGLPPETLAAVGAALEGGAAAQLGWEEAAATGPDVAKLAEANGRAGFHDLGEPAPTDGPADALPPAFSPQDFHGRDGPGPKHAAAAGRGLAGTTPPLVSPPATNDGEAGLIGAVRAVMQRTEGGSHQPIAPLSPLTPAVPDGQAGSATRFGGLFYLLSRVLELGIGESLWKVCLPEGLILAHAAGVLLGPDAAGDPAPAMFGGVTSGEMLEWPMVSPQQQAEVSVELLAATASALPRYGVAPAPEVFLDLVTSPGGRMLMASSKVTSGTGPFALFAWPAHDARAAAAGLAAFLSVWPESFPPSQGCDVLLGLDTSRRLRPVSGPMARTAPLLPAAPNAPAAALLAQICGAMAELFAVRGGDASAGASQLVSRYLAIPGRVVLEPAAMTVVLPMAGTDLAVRRAALDRDPGWVAWLQRTVRIEFAPEGGGDVV